MATALHPLRNDAGASVHSSLYPRTIMTEFELKDNRYPSLSPRARGNLGHNSSSLSADISGIDRQPSQDGQSLRRSYDQIEGSPRSMEQRPQSQDRESSLRRSAQYPDVASAKSHSQQSQDALRTSLSYVLPENVPRRVVERYSLDENGGGAVTESPIEARLNGRDSSPDTPSRSDTPQPARPVANAERPVSMMPNTPRHPDVAAASSASAASNQFPPIMPLSASPNYNPPVSARNRTYPQQPTYINPSNPPKAVNPVYTPLAPQQEEVCLECAMRDQDMADVDVASPGVWERASDVLFEELKQRELEEEAKGIVSEEENRPRAFGGRLTEQNIKIWLSINPREPASRQQTLNTYVKAQRAMLEAEALAHSRAMQEAKQLDSRMRDAYSQLRRSAYDIGSSSAPVDDTGGVRIRPPESPAHAHTRSQSREVTLLENGMIVEYVDVRKEEREARERRRREEKRARKTSRSSVLDATSIISAQSNGPLAETSLKPNSRYSHTTSTRPTSALTAPHDRPDLPRAYSQASFSDVHSLGSASPRRTKFFGMRNLSTGWRSQDSLAPSFAPSGMSGSMVDMHVALQREDRRKTVFVPNDLNSSRRSTLWRTSDPQAEASHAASEEKAKKKKSGLIKWWRMVTGSNKPDSSSSRDMPPTRLDDDLPLAPPPPISYLVARSSPDVHVNNRHGSSPSLPPTSPKFGQSNPSASPPAASSNGLPSPTSLRPQAIEMDSSEVRTVVGGYDDQDKRTEDALSNDWKLHSVASEPNLRQNSGNRNQEPVPPVPRLPVASATASRSLTISRDKSLPPIPTGEAPAFPTPADRPHTMYTYEPQTLPSGLRPPHDFLPPSAPFRSADTRRQSFGGITSRPEISIQTLPAITSNFDPRRSLGPQYDEFGFSRRSLGRLEEEQRRSISPLPASTKRKSKFGFASLLGKKNKEREVEHSLEHASQPFPSLGRHDETMNGGSFENQRTQRMSILSRKPIEDLVSQDPEFVAYRYPSTDQRLDLLR